MIRGVAAVAASLSVAGALCAVGVLGVRSAVADTPGCVTRHEYRQVEVFHKDADGVLHRGMLQPKVHKMFDTVGKPITGRSYRKYRACTGTGWSYVYVSFHRPHPFKNPDRFRAIGKRHTES